jgi:hypothetical protein
MKSFVSSVPKRLPFDLGETQCPADETARIGKYAVPRSERDPLCKLWVGPRE